MVRSGGMDKGKVALAVVAALALVAAAYFGWRAFSKPNRVVQIAGKQPPIGPLTERSGRIAPTGPLTDRTGAAPQQEPEPTDIIEYLKFLKEIERQRVLLAKAQTGELLKQSADLTYAGASADWTTNEPEEKYKEVYGRFQQSLSLWSGQWQELAARFLAYPKPVPASCGELRDRYYALLSATSTAMAGIGNSFAQAMSGDPGKALESLTQMQGSGLGSASKEVGDACAAADDALAAVCDKWKLRKDFAIRDDLGGGNLLGR
ncbi:MAG: hypothetical protein FJX72_20595 [Armatimonadetes bacterium]|nr:hypothetical protein [Armatimonadota bacterium]